MKAVNISLLVTFLTGVAADAPHEFVPLVVSVMLQLAVWEIVPREELVTDCALKRDANVVDAFLATCGPAVKRTNVFFLVTCPADVALSTPQEVVLLRFACSVELVVRKLLCGLKCFTNFAHFRRCVLFIAGMAVSRVRLEFAEVLEVCVAADAGFTCLASEYRFLF